MAHLDRTEGKGRREVQVGPGVARVLGVEVLGHPLDGVDADVAGEKRVKAVHGVRVVNWGGGGKQRAEDLISNTKSPYSRIFKDTIILRAETPLSVREALWKKPFCGFSLHSGAMAPDSPSARRSSSSIVLKPGFLHRLNGECLLYYVVQYHSSQSRSPSS